MKITVTTDNVTCSLEVADDLEIENFKVLCEVEMGIASANSIVMFNSQPLSNDKKTLKDYGVKDGDLLFIMQTRPQTTQSSQPASTNINQIDFSSIQIPGSRRNMDGVASTSSEGHGSSVIEGRENSNVQGEDDLGLGEYSGGEDDPAVVRDMLLANPEQRSLLKHHNPRLADALETGSLETFSEILKEQQDLRKDRERQRVRLIAADPFDMDAQKLIAEEIQQQNINANMEAAMEFNPESFGIVVMLYIDCKVNGHPVKAFIDSGAQTTIMSEQCAERCNIMRLVDRRWAGTARGVGTQKIIGRVHMGQIQIEGDFLASSFSILGDQSMDMLLGLDMLKRHQMVIDLKNNELFIGTTSTRTKFLPESQLPESAFGDQNEQGQTSHKYDEGEAVARTLEESRKDTVGPDQSMNYEDDEMERTLEESRKETDSQDTQAIPSGSAFNESDIKEIIQIGFSRKQAIEELTKHSGNKTIAIAALFAKSFNL